MSDPRGPQDPDEAFKARARDFHFAVLRSMADLDSHRHSELITTAERPTLEWAYYFMCQTLHAVVRNVAGDDLQAASAILLDFVQAMEALEAARSAVDGD